MLHELEVRDLGIIDRVRLELPPGLVALTGETGAGKSLLVQSLQLLSGERADSEQVRGGSDRLFVEGSFAHPGAVVAPFLDELGVAADDELVVRREVTAQGRSRAWINDVPVTMGALQELSAHLLSIQGQHDQRSLADASRHIELVDAAGGLSGARAETAAAYAAWQEVRLRLVAQQEALANRRDRIDTIAFQLREIDEARPTAGEDDDLREERNWLRHAERIGELLAAAREHLGGEGGVAALARAARAVRELAELGVGAAETADQLEQAQLLAEDADREVLALSDRVRVDPGRLEAVEGRLAVLERLARKYGGSVASVLEHREGLERERVDLENAEDDIARLGEEERHAAERYLELALDLSRARREAAATFAGRVVTVLRGLGMPRVELALRQQLRAGDAAALVVDGVTVAAAEDGIDVGEFIVSTNPGEEMRSLARIASGGELSRIHLAMRTVLRDQRRGGSSLSLLFDEVDTGIGGRVVDELARLLQELGRRDQVLVVTHLPQVAARASAHLVVNKELADGRTVTRVQPVAGAERVEELVRMLGGGPATPAARRHAEELLQAP